MALWTKMFTEVSLKIKNEVLTIQKESRENVDTLLQIITCQMRKDTN